ncbi:MAG: Fe-S cluster domain-containing protein [bacterium]|nr:Fe-S cluster domain-containing protein [bacterium]
MLEAVLILTAVGAAFGSLLAVASQKFAVTVDPRVEAIKEALPGANCGACGYPGCAGFAEAAVSGVVPADGCTAGGSDVSRRIAAILGVEVVEREREVARVLCGGGDRQAPFRFEYSGIQDCQAATLLAGGPKGCTYGCLGMGSCVRACAFDAIYMDRNRLPRVVEDRCTGCGKCVKACPRRVIVMGPVSRQVHIVCNSRDRGPVVRKVCTVGCIACRLCVKECPREAITFEDNLARIDYTRCDNCGLCVAKCPTKCIVSTAGGMEVARGA